MSVTPSPASGSIFNQVGIFSVEIQLMFMGVVCVFIVLIGYTLFKKSKKGR